MANTQSICQHFRCRCWFGVCWRRFLSFLIPYVTVGFCRLKTKRKFTFFSGGHFQEKLLSDKGQAVLGQGVNIHIGEASQQRFSARDSMLNFKKTGAGPFLRPCSIHIRRNSVSSPVSLTHSPYARIDNLPKP